MITVVIPLFNGARYIRRSVQSVLGQSYTDFELIVVDDGSEDGGAEIVLAFTDPRLRLVRQENQGVSAARNKGIVEGRGQSIAFLDADDAWDCGFLDALVNLSRIYPQAGIYGTGFRMLFPEGPGVEVTAAEAAHQETSLLLTDYFYRADGGNLINASGMMIPRRIFEAVGVFLIGEHQGEDVEMWARIALRFPIGYDTRILFSVHQTGIINKPRYKNIPKYSPKIEMLQKALDKSPDSLVHREMIRSHIKTFLRKRCLFFVLNYKRADTVEFMLNSQAATWAPLLDRLIKISLLWPFMKLAAWFGRAAHSRPALRILGGQCVSHGVLMRVRAGIVD